MNKKVLGSLAFIIAAALFFVYTRPAYDEVRAMRMKVAEYDSALDKAAELQRLKQTLLSRYNAMDPAGLERLRKLLPDHVDNVRLILDLDTMASRHGMALENVAVGDEAESGERKTVVGAIGSGRHKYDSISIRFGTSGTYTDFKRFMQDLEASLRIVDVVNLKMERESAAVRVSSIGGEPEPVFRYTITMRTYWLK